MPGESDSWDLGIGAGFYLDATKAPWNKAYQMESFIVHELRPLVAKEFPSIDESRTGIFGHSMGGHGALTLALKYPDIFRSCSAFAPIAHPSHCEWGKKAFTAYLQKEEEWKLHDACELLANYVGKGLNILIHVGTGDKFYNEGQLLPEDLVEAANDVNEVKVDLKKVSNYDHR